MRVPGYFWKTIIIIYAISELRKLMSTIFEYIENREDTEEEIPQSVKHLYS